MTGLHLNFTGLLTGLATFVIIGLFHPVVIKCHYYFGVKCWWWFLLAGLAFAAASLYVDNGIWSTILGVTAFSSFWTILEIFEQRERVRKGWFPDNPNRKNVAYNEPNDVTKAAIEEARSGKLQNSSSVDTSSIEAMFKSMGL